MKCKQPRPAGRAGQHHEYLSFNLFQFLFFFFSYVFTVFSVFVFSVSFNLFYSPSFFLFVLSFFSIYIHTSSSSCRAACADIPDRLSPFLLIIHRLRQVFRVTSRVLTQLLYVSSCWSSHSCTSMCGGPQEYIAYELVLASPAVSCVSGSSNLYSFCDGGMCPYSWSLVGCCRQDLFNTALNILV